MIDPWREQPTADLLCEAVSNPVAVLRALRAKGGHLDQAIELATHQFDPHNAAQCVREAAGLLGVIAEALRADALRPANKPRRRRAKSMPNPTHASALNEEEIVPF